MPDAFEVAPLTISPIIKRVWDDMNNLLLLSTSSTRTFAVAPDVWPVTVSPTSNFISESSRTIWSPFSSNTKFTDSVSSLR